MFFTTVREGLTTFCYTHRKNILKYLRSEKVLYKISKEEWNALSPYTHHLHHSVLKKIIAIIKQKRPCCLYFKTWVLNNQQWYSDPAHKTAELLIKLFPFQIIELWKRYSTKTSHISLILDMNHCYSSETKEFHPDTQIDDEPFLD